MSDPRPITLDDLESVYLDGFCTGIATFAVNVGQAPEEADEFAESIAAQLRGDTAAMNELRNQIVERLNGADGGPGTSMTVKDNQNEEPSDV
ncbi:hypothetical protein ACWDTG_06895 [Rhodococcus zopfii]